MKITKTILTIILLSSPLCSHAAMQPCSHAANEELVSLKTREGVEQKYILIKAENALASVILFAGGKGSLGLSGSSDDIEINWGKGNFLVRTKNMFAEQGLNVAVVDAPSDMQSKKGMLGGFRNSSEHVTDIDHVIADMRKRSGAPVWLVGTSRGTESAANITINSQQKPDGLVLTSAITVENAKGIAVTEMPINNITIPTLIVAHNDDQCEKAPPQRAYEVKKLMTASK